MGFKLVRVDETQPYKVLLPIGSHYVGRGRLLDCDDNRVSRNHAELIVTADSILLTAKHQNPCFLKKKSSTDIIVFSQPDSQVLSNGDQFGLIPDNYWYEVIECSEDSPTDCKVSIDETNEQENSVNQNNANRDKDINTQMYNYEEEENMLDCSESLLNEVVNTPFQLSQENQSSTVKEPENESEKPPKDNFEDMDTAAIEQPVESTNPSAQTTNQTVESTNESESARAVTPTKRVHSEENSPCDVKRVKTEPKESPDKDSNVEAKAQPIAPQATSSDQAVKTEPDSSFDAKPGPSNDQGGPSKDGNGTTPAMPPSPTKPPSNQLRERCMYGANCYRRNPQHKAQFSHPSDPDWGTGQRGVCPWGASCQKVDPRHWRDHDHPPGVHPPQPRPRGNGPGMQLVRRHGNNFYINANSVHFYDDHFEVGDSDGDSVDYDYEF